MPLLCPRLNKERSQLPTITESDNLNEWTPQTYHYQHKPESERRTQWKTSFNFIYYYYVVGLSVKE